MIYDICYINTASIDGMAMTPNDEYTHPTWAHQRCYCRHVGRPGAYHLNHLGLALLESTKNMGIKGDPRSSICFCKCRNR